MEHLLFIIIGILLLMIFVLLAKVYFLRKSAQEIAEAFRDRLTVDTNTLIDISSRDPYMRKLAADINVHNHRYRFIMDIHTDSNKHGGKYCSQENRAEYHLHNQLPVQCKFSEQDISGNS